MTRHSNSSLLPGNSADCSYIADGLHPPPAPAGNPPQPCNGGSSPGRGESLPACQSPTDGLEPAASNGPSACTASQDVDTTQQRLAGALIDDGRQNGNEHIRHSSTAQPPASSGSSERPVGGLPAGSEVLETSSQQNVVGSTEHESESEEEEDELPPLHRNPNRRVIVHDVSDSDEDA